MVEELGTPENGDGGTRPRRRLGRWGLAVGAAVLVTGVIVGIVVAQPRDDGAPAGGGGTAGPGGTADQGWMRPRFVVTADEWGDTSGGAAWFRIHEYATSGQERLVEAVQPPSPSGGEVTSIVAGPDRTFLVAAWRAESCETDLYRFTLTEDGHAEDLAPVTGGRVPALAAGPAISPDGRRIAYATGGCGGPEGSPAATAPIALAVLDSGTGRQRTWTSARPAVVGEIVWASDNRTLGYTTAEIVQPGPAVGPVHVRAVDVDAPADDLLAGRVLFTQPEDAEAVTTAVMNRDGRTGYGVLREDQPPSQVLFSFSEGRPITVTSTIPDDPDSVTMMSFADDSPRYACLGGIDAFGRVDEDRSIDESPDRFGNCSTAYPTV